MTYSYIDKKNKSSVTAFLYSRVFSLTEQQVTLIGICVKFEFNHYKQKFDF